MILTAQFGALAKRRVIGSVTPARMLYTTYNKTSGGSEDLVIYLPDGYGDTPGKQYHLLMYYHGDGADGTFTHVNGAAMTDMGSNLYQITAGNTGSRRVLYSSIIVSVGGVEVARVKRNMNGSNGSFYSTGAIAGITGTASLNGSSSLFQIQFPSAPGGAVTVSYKHSALFETGLPPYLNAGSFDYPETVICMVQKAANDTYYVVADHFTDLRNYMIANYSIDTNRIVVTGLSRGGFLCVDLLEDPTTRALIAGFAINSANGITLSDWSVISDKGFIYIAGQNESADGYPPANTTFLNTCGGLSLHNYPGSVFVQGQGHTSAVWSTNCYNVGTALFDLRQWTRVWHLTYNNQATLHVEMAEETLDIDRWREAMRAVYFMSSGATKTDLQARLAAVKSAIDGAKKRWVFDFGTTSDTELYLNVNSLSTSFAAGTTYSSLKDDNNNVTGVGLTVVSQLATGPTNRFSTSTRGANPQFGFSQAHYSDGINMQTTVTTGQFKITGLDPAKQYKLRFYIANGSTSNAHNMSVSLTVGGVTTSHFDTYTNRRVPTFDNVSPNSSGEIAIGAYASGDTNMILNLLQLEEK